MSETGNAYTNLGRANITAAIDRLNPDEAAQVLAEMIGLSLKHLDEMQGRHPNSVETAMRDQAESFSPETAQFLRDFAGAAAMAQNTRIN